MMTRRTLLAAAALGPAARAERVFNGNNLDGWRQHGNGLWTVEAGCIVCRFDPKKPGPGHLLTERDFGDFRLDLEFWISQGGNSGVFIRQPLREFGTRGASKPAQRPTDGVEVQICYVEPKNLTGAVYNKSKPTSLRGGEKQWTAMRIECRGERVTVAVDGQHVSDYGPLASPRGVIGFQMHGQLEHDHVVRFRNIMITE
jgi:hypothetical protein